LFAINNLAGTIPHNDVNIKLNRFKAIYGDIGVSFKLGQSNKESPAPSGLIEVNLPQFQNLNRFPFLSYEENVSNPFVLKIKTNSIDFEKTNESFKGAKNIAITK